MRVNIVAPGLADTESGVCPARAGNELGLDLGRGHTVCVGDDVVGRPVDAVLAPAQ